MDATATAARDAGFEAALEENRADQGLRLVYADWCEERADEGYARALRLLARLGRYPMAYEYRSMTCGLRIPCAIFTRDGVVSQISRYSWAGLPGVEFEKLHGLIRRTSRYGSGRYGGRLPDFERLYKDRFRAPMDGRYTSWLFFHNVQKATEWLARSLEAP